MIDLTELEMRILAELEEAGEENAAALLNTIIRPTGDDSEISDLQRALQRLITGDLVRIATDVDASGRLVDLSQRQSLEVANILRSKLAFDSTRKLWTSAQKSDRSNGRSLPQVVNTLLGKERGRELINLRGWEWYKRS
jgi:hypothetical protein